MSQVMPFQDPDLEKLYTFCRFFQNKLPHDPKKAPLQLDGDVALRYYRIDKIAETEIKLTVNDGGVLRSPTEVGTRQAKEEEASLSEIIEVLNERFGAGLTEAHRIFVDGVQKYAVTDPQVVDWARSNSLENFLLPLRPRLADKIVDLLDSAPEFAGRYLNEPEFQELAFKMMGKAIYDAARATAT